jgi:hypothetical protein
MIESDRTKASFLLGVRSGPATQPLPAGLRGPKLEVRIGEAIGRPTGDGVPLERVSSNEMTTRTNAEEVWFDKPPDGSSDEREPGTQRDVTTDRVRPREPHTTDELLRASGSRRREWKIAMAAVALLAVIAFFIMRRDKTVSADAGVQLGEAVTPPVALNVVAHEPPPPVATESAPVPVEPVADGPGPRKLPVQARPGQPVVAIAAPATKEPPKAEDVLALYQSLGRELKGIADRRDMSADDLWVRYRRVRIQDVMTSTTKRAEALAILMAIDREIGKRFRGSGI